MKSEYEYSLSTPKDLQGQFPMLHATSSNALHFLYYHEPSISSMQTRSFASSLLVQNTINFFISSTLFQIQLDNR